MMDGVVVNRTEPTAEVVAAGTNMSERASWLCTWMLGLTVCTLLHVPSYSYLYLTLRFII